MSQKRSGKQLTIRMLKLVGLVLSVGLWSLLLYSYRDSPTLSLADNSQFECMVANVYHEARGEPFAGQVHVASVVLNRVDDKRWPSTECEVIYQPYQFSWTQDKLSNATPDSNAVIMATRAVTEAYNKRSTNANLYHATYVSPSWARRVEFLEQVGNHLFYKE